MLSFPGRTSAIEPRGNVGASKCNAWCIARRRFTSASRGISKTLCEAYRKGMEVALLGSRRE